MAEINNAAGVIDFLSSSAPDLPSKAQTKKLCKIHDKQQLEAREGDNHLTYTHHVQKVFHQIRHPC